MTDIKSVRLLRIKGGPFLLIGTVASVLLWLVFEKMNIRLMP